jgi:hypothetical protein
MKTPLTFAEIAFAQATSHEFFGNPLELRRNAKMTVNFRKSPSNFIKIKLYSIYCSDNLMKPPQALHNYHLFKPPLGQFNVISLDRVTKFYNNQLTIHPLPTNQRF